MAVTVEGVTVIQPHVSQMDVVYPVRHGETNEELRYSLRSLDANFPHADVWIVGHKPDWVHGVRHLEGNVYPRYEANGYGNLHIAARCPEVSEWFVIFNDDFFVTDRVQDLETLYHCTLQYHIDMPAVQKSRGWFLEQLESTMSKLKAKGVAEPLSYEIHTPMAVNRLKFLEILDEYEHELPDSTPQCRSLYGNIMGVGGRKAYDVKFHVNAEMRKPYHSTDDRSFVYFRRRLEQMFPGKCRYEV